jgi:hypothetical protein
MILNLLGTGVLVYFKGQQMYCTVSEGMQANNMVELDRNKIRHPWANIDRQ